MDRNALGKVAYEAAMKAYQATKTAAPVPAPVSAKPSAKKAAPGQKRPATISPEKIVKAATPAKTKSAKKSVQKVVKPVAAPAKPEPKVEAPVVEETPVLEPVPETISMAEFLSVCIFLSERCGDVIREVHASGDLKIEKKEQVNDTLNPVTIADIRVQKTLEENLKAIWPNLKIQGEEAAASLE